jgi:MOSC domain-containing protein YiiM
MLATLVSVTVGKVQHMAMPQGKSFDGKNPTWSSAIFKNPVDGPVRVTTENVEGDQQADLNFHGGPDNVVLAYNAAHYDVWRKELSLPELPFGAMGENFTFAGEFSDETVCIGDTWQVGDEKRGVLLQVTQPRQPCYKLARRLGTPLVVKLVKQRGWGGWYSRVLREGVVEKGMQAKLLERLHPQWNCVAAAHAMYLRNQDPDRAAALATLPALSTRWKQELIDAF